MLILYATSRYAFKTESDRYISSLDYLQESSCRRYLNCMQYNCGYTRPFAFTAKITVELLQKLKMWPTNDVKH